jgi:multiple antibiotic resistance protein
MPLSKVVLLSFVTLITMVNPLAVIPSFVALTDRLSNSGRARVALIASMAVIVVLTVFLIAGNWVFQFFGITVPAFQIMGGIVFFTNALHTLVQTDERSANTLSGDKRMENQDVEKAEIDPSSIAVVPLAIPMLAGPGAITSTMLLVNSYPRYDQKLAVALASAASASSPTSSCSPPSRSPASSAIAAAPCSPKSWPSSSAPSAFSSSSTDSNRC